MYKAVNYQNNTTEYIFSQHLLSRESPIFQISANWSIKPRPVFDIGKAGILYKKSSKGSQTHIYTINDTLVWLTIEGTSINVRVAASSDEACDTMITTLRLMFPEAEQADDGKIDVNFWFNSINGPRSILREIEAPSWNSVESNYEANTKEALQKLLLNFQPSHGGQIILWHGVPGTGKTYALRALCNQWKDWCDIDYILDPEVLLNDSNYLTNVILEDETSHHWDAEQETYVEDESKWKLLIMEDTGELIAENAKERTGQGLSRLLNIADGFIGQGLRVLILITTNEKMEKLHPAVSRPGRCAAAIGFNPLSRDDAYRWLGEHGADAEGLSKNSYPISELYAIKEKFGEITPPKKSVFGFHIEEVEKIAV
jgi:hypothetical protein